MNSPILSSPTPPHYAIIEAAPRLGPRTKLQYKRAIDRLHAEGIDPRNTKALAAYAQNLPASSRAFLKAALRLLYEDVETVLEASARPDNLAEVQSSLLNIKAMKKVIDVQKPEGTKAHVWLSREQVEQITALPDNRRDHIVLAVLLGAGLRRSELAELTFDALKQQPAGSGMRDILEVRGKGEKSRVVPISQALARHLKSWHKTVGDGRVARAVNKAGAINGSLSDHAINDIVAKYGAMIGIPELTAHDLRRTYARLGYDAGVRVEQISKLLGHSDVKTTMIYLGIDLDLESTISDFIPLSD